MSNKEALEATKALGVSFSFWKVINVQLFLYRQVRQNNPNVSKCCKHTQTVAAVLEYIVGMYSSRRAQFFSKHAAKFFRQFFDFGTVFYEVSLIQV